MIHARAVPERSTRTAAEGEGGRQLIAVELVVELTCDGRASQRGLGWIMELCFAAKVVPQRGVAPLDCRDEELRCNERLCRIAGRYFRQIRRKKL